MAKSKKLKKFKRRFEDRFANPAFAIFKELIASSEITFGKDSVTVKFKPTREK